MMQFCGEKKTRNNKYKIIFYSQNKIFFGYSFFLIHRNFTLRISVKLDFFFVEANEKKSILIAHDSTILMDYKKKLIKYQINWIKKFSRRTIELKFTWGRKLHNLTSIYEPDRPFAYKN